MSGYSRDTFRLTNALHQIVLGEAVVGPRHYVDVRIQQGVPVVDADWNELEDIRRREVELMLRDVIGDGVAGMGLDFAIGPVEVDNSFAIQPGVVLVGGWQVINPAAIAYLDQPRFFSGGVFVGTDLTTPVTDRIDLVYLDGWEELIGAAGDGRLVDPRIGIETSQRTERRWTVRVAENATDLAALGLAVPGHKYALLARLYRRAGVPRIGPEMIEDRRRLGLALATALKAPMYLSRGTEIVNPVRFSTLLAELHNVLRTWQENALFPIVLATIEAYFQYQNALNRIYQLATSAEVGSITRTLDNQDGLAVLARLAEAQEALLEVVETFGTGVPSDMEVINEYRRYLDGDPGAGIPGLEPALAAADLLAAVKAQEALTTWLGLTTGDLPEGAVTAVLRSVLPATPIVAGAPLTLTYEVTSQLSSPTTSEDFDLEVTVSDVRWAAALSDAEVSLAPGASADVVVTVTPAGTLIAGDFADIALVARAHRRPSIHSVQPEQTFTIGALPPGETFFFYSGAVALVGGELNIPRAGLSAATYDVFFTLVNSTGGAQQHFFEIEYQLVWPGTLPAGLDPTMWAPNGTETIAEHPVPGAQSLLIVSLTGQDLSAIVGAFSVTLEITATLVRVDATPVPSGKTATITIPINVPAV